MTITCPVWKGKLNCVCCSGIAKRRGFYTNKNFRVQRYECLKCGTSFSQKLPLDNLRVDFKQACQVANMLCEGIGIRAISRLTGLHQQTVLGILRFFAFDAFRFRALMPARIFERRSISAAL